MPDAPRLRVYDLPSLRRKLRAMAKTRKANEQAPDGAAHRAAGAAPDQGQARQTQEAPEAMSPSRDEQAAALAHALAAPFDVAEVKFKPQTVSGNRALAIPFVDARVIQDRLDEVLGVLNWQDSYEVLPDGAVVCALRIRLGGEWVTKMDVGGQSEQPDEGDRRKAAFSDALKRAAVKFGIGRYLYRQKPQWVDYDPQKRQFVRQPVLAADKPAQAPEQPKNGQAQKAAKLPGPDFLLKLQEYDAKLAAEGVCKAGELVKAVALMGEKQGFPQDMTLWDSDNVAAGREETVRFVNARRARAAS